jgi:hypothetical protein
VTAFTHVIDCRDALAPAARGYDCSGGRAGRVYVQYWTYYGDSATSRALIGSRGYHADDWEGYEIRINRDGSVDARATSHNGFNGADNPVVDWASDAAGKLPGARAVRDAAEGTGLRAGGGWTRSEDTLYVSGGSHAGHAGEGSLGREVSGLVASGVAGLGGRSRRGDPLAAAQTRHDTELLADRLERTLFGPGSRVTPRGSLRLVPIETLDALERHSFAVTPPWRKRVYRDPEYAGTD